MNSVSFEPTKRLGRTKKALDGSGIDPIEERLEGTGSGIDGDMVFNM